MVVVARRDREIKDRVYDVSLDFLLERLASVSPKVLDLSEFERLRPSAAPFWERFRRDEQVLWERTT